MTPSFEMLRNSVLNTNISATTKYNLYVYAGDTEVTELSSTVKINQDVSEPFSTHLALDSVVGSIKEILDAVHIHYEGGKIADQHIATKNVSDIFDSHPSKHTGIYALRSHPTWDPDMLERVVIYNGVCVPGFFYNTYKSEKILTIDICPTTLLLDIPYSDDEFDAEPIKFLIADRAYLRQRTAEEQARLMNDW